MLESKISHLPSLAQLTHEYLARKSLGQNFLLDPNIARKIVDSADIAPHDTVVEIGPGLGSLTRLLLLSPAQEIILIEKDKRFFDPLNQLVALAPTRVTLYIADALRFPLAEHLKGPCKILANLPYNIGTQLVIDWLGTPQRFTSLTLMLQKEVVERLVAAPGTAAYGRLSIIAQWVCEIKKIMIVPASAFKPAPKVASAVVQLIPRAQPLYPAQKEELEHLTHLLFQHRRKMVRGSLRGKIPNLEQALERCGISPTARPETLSIEALCKLTHSMG